MPYPREDELAKLWAHLHEEAPSTTDSAPEVPADLDEVVGCAMAKRPEDSYASAGELGAATLAAAADKPPGRRHQEPHKG